VQAGDSVAVFGLGPIGLGIIAALRMRGIEDIIAFEPSALRRERALALGVREAFDPGQTPPAEALGKVRGHGQIWGVDHPKTDIYFEASGAPGLNSDMARFCNKRSRIITVAMQRQPVTLDGTKIMSKEISLIGASGYPTEFPEVMHALGTNTVDAEAMITHRFPFASFLDAFEVADDPSKAAKVLLTFD
jgi:threonine dehydrogenase-like Zn-dependent dehydrogenase